MGEAKPVLDDRGQPLAVDFLVTRKLGIECEPVTQQGASCQFLDQRVSGTPLCWERWLIEEPAVQPHSALVRDGGIEQMGQRMGTNEVEICRVGVRARSVSCLFRDVSPIQRNAGKMCPFNLLPLAEPMNLGLHLVMIGRDGDKDSQEEGEREVAALVPVEFIEGNGTDQADQENREPPPGEEGAGLRALSNQVVCALDDGLNLEGAWAYHNRRPYWNGRGTSNREAYLVKRDNPDTP